MANSQGDFVIMTFDQMDEFDASKQCECKQEYSYLKKASLLAYYLKESQKVPDIVKKFGHVYVCVSVNFGFTVMYSCRFPTTSSLSF